MPLQIDFEVLNQLSEGKQINQIQIIFDKLLYYLIDYLNLEPIYTDISIAISKEAIPTKEAIIPILEFSVKNTEINNSLLIEILESKFLPFILLRELYYCFIPKEIKKIDIIKICINQIVENDLIKLKYIEEWKKYIRNVLVDRDFIVSQFDRLQKFFKIDAKEPFENTIQFFFNDLRENATLVSNRNIENFYDLLFERYSYKNSRSLFNEEIVEALRILIILFYKQKLYLNLSDYQTLLKEYLEEKKIELNLSFKKFTENLQWINKCSSIAPSYNPFYNTIKIIPVHSILFFNPHLEKYKIKKILQNLPFFASPKFSENSLVTEVSMVFLIPERYIDDLLNFFNKMESVGILVEKKVYLIQSSTNFLNLNYFLDFSNTKGILDPNIALYQKKYEIESTIEYTKVSKVKNFTMFDFIILNRIRNLSVTGLTFDKRIETLNAIKEDVRNEYRKQMTYILDFKSNFNSLLNNPNFKNEFHKFLEENQSQGFFTIYNKINSILTYISLIDPILKNNPSINSDYQLNLFLDTRYKIKTIEENIILKEKITKKIIFREIIPLYFKSIKLYKEEIEKLHLYYDVFDSCYNLKIFNVKSILEILANPIMINKISKIKEEKLRLLYKSEKLSKINNQKIEQTLGELLNYNPPIIKPLLINTILTSTFAKYYPSIILRDSQKTRKKIRSLKSYFPRILINNLEEVVTKEKYILVLIYLVNIKEKSKFTSILSSIFKNEVLSCKRYFWRGIERVSRVVEKEFYDFENHQFFYTRDLFDQLFIYIQKVLGDKILTSFNKKSHSFQSKLFWSTNINMDALVKLIKIRLSYQNISYKLNNLNELTSFQRNLNSYLLNQQKFLSIKSTEFFNQYVKSIKFLPAFRKFGMAQYCLYIRPGENVDLKLILTNTFQKVEYPASIEDNQAIYIKYLFPYRKPNTTYLNWLIKSKKALRESCLFYKKKVYTVIQFDLNLSSQGWNYSSNRFKIHLQNVLFNPKHRPEIPNLREFNIDEYSEGRIYGPSSHEFKILSQIYNWQSLDIKSYLGSKKHSIINNITKLIERNLIFPYISLKNLEFQDKISIILPNVQVELNNKIIDIFSFFNFCRIYEIEGEFFIYGLNEIETFENGFLIEIWFPKCEMDEFLDVFALLSQYLEIKHYLIFSDLVNGKTLLRSIFGNLNFLKKYNPLINLKWNSKDKIWMNHKLFNEKFESLYPDLFFGFKKDKNNNNNEDYKYQQ